MNRTIEQWRNCDPAAMATQQSEGARMYAFQDARADILWMYSAIKTIRRQRDALLAAARAAEAVFAAQKWREDGLDPEAVALRLLRAAIASAESGEVAP